MRRRSKNVINDVALLKRYLGIIKKYKPGLIITYTIKPNLYGAIAARVTGTPYIMNITGLGTELENKGFTNTALITSLKPLMQKSNCVFFQNVHHLNMFCEKGIVKSENARLVAGSGVNLQEHRVLDYEEHGDFIHFLYVGRIMQAKGISELIEATKLARLKNPNIRVSALGFCEREYKETFERLNEDEAVTKLDYTDDVDSVVALCDAVINPSYHEGLSNALLEGAACGRPLLASDVTGCVETLDDGETGYVFHVRDAGDLAEKMLKFAALSSDERRKMGLKGRAKVEKQYDRKTVVDAYMQEIYKVLETKPQEGEHTYAESVGADGSI